MPVPLILTGLGVAAGVLGAAGHSVAKETNEKAQRISEDAQRLYNTAKASLEMAQHDTEKALLKLGYAKKETLDRSMKQFLADYAKIKDISISQSAGLNEISNFIIDRQEAVQIQEMSDIYQSSIQSGAAGAAAGAVVALAASGSLPIVTGGLSIAGSALAAGEIGAAAGIAGSALSFGAAMTPLAAVAAPVLFFTALSASMKADENLEKAQTMYAQAEAASEKMKVSETLCAGISERSEMFYDVLHELDGMFLECVMLLHGVVRKKEGRIFKKKLKAEHFTDEEIRLMAVTRALAGAVKAVIDTPILTSDGTLSFESKDVYEQTVCSLPDLSRAAEEVKAADYQAKPAALDVKQKTSVTGKNAKAEVRTAYKLSLPVKAVMWFCTVMLVLCGVSLLSVSEIIAGGLWIIGGLMMCPKISSSMKFLPRLGRMFLLVLLGCFFM